MFKKVLILLAALAAPIVANSFVELTFSARDLPDEDICCSPPVYPPDSYAIVYYSPSDFDIYTEVGETIIIDNKHDPSWPEIFTFPNQTLNTTGRIKVEVMDSDVDADDYMGFVEFKIRDILSSFGQRLEKQLSPTGEGFVIVNARVNGTFSADTDEEIEIQKKFEDRRRVIEFSEVPISVAAIVGRLEPAPAEPKVTIEQIKPGKFFPRRL